MIDDISKDLFKIELPLPDNPLMSVNCYLIKGRDRSLLIDTGMNRKECIEEMLKDLKRINISLDRTDLFITHLHSDHIGLASKLRTETSKIYFNSFMTLPNFFLCVGFQLSWYVFTISHSSSGK